MLFLSIFLHNSFLFLYSFDSIKKCFIHNPHTINLLINKGLSMLPYIKSYTKGINTLSDDT